MSATTTDDTAVSNRQVRDGRRVGLGLRALEYGPPVAAFIAASLMLWVAARMDGAAFFSAVTWFKWDSTFYAQIAHQGYFLPTCGSATCGGDVAWFAGYPGVLAILYDLGLPQVGMAVAVSWFFDLAALLVLWNAFLRTAPPLLGYVALVFAACCPGGIYMRTAFPMSTTVFFVLLWFLALRERRWLWAGVAGGCAAACYPTAVLLAPLAGVWILFGVPGSAGRRLLWAVACGAMIAAGTFIVLAIDAIETGYWNSFFRGESSYHHGLHQPFAFLWPMIKGAFSATGVASNVSGVYLCQDIEALLAAAVAIALLLGLIVLALQRRTTRWDWFVMLFVLAFWLLPGTQANESWWRGDALLLPAALLVVRMRGELALLICCASAAVFPWLAYWFFAGNLV